MSGAVGDWRLVALMLLIRALLAAGCSDGTKTEKEATMLKPDAKTEAEITAVFHRFFEAYAARDLNALMATQAQDPDVVALGSGKDERRVGAAEITAQIQRDWSQTESASFQDEWRHVSASGNTAWLASDGKLSWTDGGQKMNAPARFSAVFVRQDGKWFMAQHHFAFIEADQAEGQSFPK